MTLSPPKITVEGPQGTGKIYLAIKAANALRAIGIDARVHEFEGSKSTKVGFWPDLDTISGSPNPQSVSFESPVIFEVKHTPRR